MDENYHAWHVRDQNRNIARVANMVENSSSGDCALVL